jgi:hypothetical protein
VDQVGQHLAVLGTDDGTRGDRDLDALAGPAVAALPAAVGAVGGPAERVVAEGEERGHVVVGHQPDVAARTAVAAVGAAAGHVGLPPEGHRPGPPVARLGVQVCLVDELGHYRASMSAAAGACEPMAGRIRSAGYGRAQPASEG